MADDGTPDDSGFGGGYGSPGGFGAGGYGGFNPMLPMYAQAMQMDPRFALAHALMAGAQQNFQQPTYNFASALAKGLTMGLAGGTTAYLQNQYAGANANTGDLDEHLAAALPEGSRVAAMLRDTNPTARLYGRMAVPGALAAASRVVTLNPSQVTATAGGPTMAPGTGVPLTPDAQRLVDARVAALRGDTTGAAALNSITAANAAPGGITYQLGGAASAVPGGAGDPNYIQSKALATALGTGQGELPNARGLALAKALGAGQGEATYAKSIAAGKAEGALPSELALDRFKTKPIRENMEEFMPPLPPSLQKFVYGGFSGGGPTPQAAPVAPAFQSPAPPPPSAAVITPSAAPSVAASGFPPPRAQAPASADQTPPIWDRAPPANAGSGAGTVTPAQAPPGAVAAPPGSSLSAGGNSNLTITPVPGGGTTIRNDGERRSVTANNESLYQQYRDVAAANVPAEKNMRNAADAFQYFQGGKGTELSADTAGWLKTAGIDPKSFNLADPAQVEIAKKSVIQSIFSQMAGVKNPALAEFGMLEKAVSQPDFQPASAKAILANAIAKMHYQNDFAQEMGNYRQEHGTMRGYDSTPFLANGVNLMNGYQEQAHQSMPQFMGEGAGGPARKGQSPTYTRAELEAEYARRQALAAGAK